MSVARTKQCKSLAMNNYNINGSLNVSSLRPTLNSPLDLSKHTAATILSDKATESLSEVISLLLIHSQQHGCCIQAYFWLLTSHSTSIIQFEYRQRTNKRPWRPVVSCPDPASQSPKRGVWHLLTLSLVLTPVMLIHHVTTGMHLCVLQSALLYTCRPRLYYTATPSCYVAIVLFL